MEKVKVLVVEDEVVIAQSIISMIEKMGFECVGTAIRATKGLEIAKEKKPDIALLDINLKGQETGIWLAQELKKSIDIPFIYLTSFGDKKTIEEAATTVPYGYILKPVQQQSIFAAITTALTKFESEKETGSDTSQLVEPEAVKNTIFVKDEYQYIKISLSDIKYIKSDGNYIEIYGTQKIVLKETLKNILVKLDPTRFVQVHRSYVINIEKIDKIGGALVYIDGTEIPLVKNKKDQLLNLFNTLH